MSLYIKLSCDVLTDAKLMAVGPSATLIYIRGLLYSKQHSTDGFVPQSAYNLLTIGVNRATKCVQLLTDPKHGPLWHVVDGGWTVGADKWAKHQTTREQVESRQRSTRERVARWRARQEGHSNASVTPLQNSCNASVTPPEPEPEYRARVNINSPTGSLLLSQPKDEEGAADAALCVEKIQNGGEDLFGGIEPKKAEAKTPKPDASESDAFKSIKAAWQAERLHQTQYAWEARGSQGYSSKGLAEAVVKIAKAEGVDRVCQAIRLYAAQMIDTYQFSNGRQQPAQAFSTFFGTGKATWREYIERVPTSEESANE